MGLHVALIHDAVIPPPLYGGTERVIALLAQALLLKGHRITLVSRRGSQVPGAEWIAYQEDWAKRLPADVDLVHLHAPYRGKLALPHVTTIHGNGQPGEVFDHNSVFVSGRHAALHGSAHFVYNGIDPDAYASSSTRTGRWVFLAKASWSVKNLEGALRVARVAGVELEVIGSRNWPFGWHRKVPRVDGVRYWGTLGEEEKRTVLAHSEGLLFPVRWHEPFGLAVIEALASGCPVLATPYGSLPEIVTPDVGWLSNNAQTWVDRLTGVFRWDREDCRARVRAKFSHHAMAEGYLHYYNRVLETGRLAISADMPPPRTQPGFVAQRLLEWNEKWH